MDNIFEKLGLYDFFGLFLPGIFFIIVLILIDFPLINAFSYPDSEIFQAVAFVLISFICGSTMQEIGSFIDKKTVNIRISARQKYLEDKELSESEREKVKSLVNELLGKEADYTPNDKECEYVFFYCKEYLENEEKMYKANKLDAIYAMSRDFVVCNFLLSICIIATNIINKSYTNWGNWLFLIILAVSVVIFYYRAKRYAKMRVRSIFRRYMICKKTE